MARLPVSPRLASMLTDAAAVGTAGEKAGLRAAGGDKHAAGAATGGTSTDLLSDAALAAALLENGDPLTPDAAQREGADISRRMELLGSGSNRGSSAGLKEGAVRRIHKEAKRLKRTVASNTGGSPRGMVRAAQRAHATGEVFTGDSGGAGIGSLLAAAYPDRIARRLDREAGYLLASGVQAGIAAGEHRFAPDWIVAASLHLSGRRGKIHLAAELTPEEIEEILAQRASGEQRLDIDDEGRLGARKVRRLGSIVVSETPISPADLESADEVLARAIRERERGIELLPWSKKARQLRARLSFLRAAGAGGED